LQKYYFCCNDQYKQSTMTRFLRLSGLVSFSLILLNSCMSTQKLHRQDIDTQQMLVAIAESNSSTVGYLQRYERKHKNWRKVGAPIKVNFGKNGLAWGRGLHTAIPDGESYKVEGDGKAPEGIFRLSRAFGTNPQGLDLQFDYVTTHEALICVDDSKSKCYNQVLDSSNLSVDWDSHENMLRGEDGLYKYGIVVEHNTSPAVAQGGSCIFMHIWRGEGKPTAGCTAMAEENMLTIIKWLRNSAKPVFVLLEKKHWSFLSKHYRLPRRGFRF
jgi:L,D-peptidoglycan transpeptidase YkuD (ErfK/YbiS/YcfS/YnhG family)